LERGVANFTTDLAYRDTRVKERTELAKMVGVTIRPTVLPVFDSVGVISTVRIERAVEARMLRWNPIT